MTIVTLNEPGFVNGWGYGWGWDSPSTGTLITNDTAPVSAVNCGRIQNATDEQGGFTEEVTLSLATQYTYSVYLKNNGGNTDCLLQIRETSGFSAVGQQVATITSSWARYSCTFTSHASVAGHVLYFKGDTGTGFDFFADAFQLETGATATTYVGEGVGGGGSSASILLLGV